MINRSRCFRPATQLVVSRQQRMQYRYGVITARNPSHGIYTSRQKSKINRFNRSLKIEEKKKSKANEEILVRKSEQNPGGLLVARTQHDSSNVKEKTKTALSRSQQLASSPEYPSLAAILHHTHATPAIEKPSRTANRAFQHDFVLVGGSKSTLTLVPRFDDTR